jgi:hypothetical protein
MQYRGWKDEYVKVKYKKTKERKITERKIIIKKHINFRIACQIKIITTKSSKITFIKARDYY